jgi:hypothetical protein
MGRSRSSFELTNAIATASTLAREERKKTVAPAAELTPLDARGLVSFAPAEAAVPMPVAVPAPPVAPVVEEPPPSEPEQPPDTPRALHDGNPTPHAGTPAHIAREAMPTPHAGTPAQPFAIPPPPPGSERAGDEAAAEKREPPRMPDLSNVVSPVVRCEKVVEWIAAATEGSGVFLADADGLPVAGEFGDAEARIGASGLVASSIATLLQALPGQLSPLFVVHVGEGPYFHLIGFRATQGTYVVGLWRAEPLSPRQAQAVRLACRHAFGEPLATPATESKP